MSKEWIMDSKLNDYFYIIINWQYISWYFSMLNCTFWLSLTWEAQVSSVREIIVLHSAHCRKIQLSMYNVDHKYTDIRFVGEKNRKDSKKYTNVYLWVFFFSSCVIEYSLKRVGQRFSARLMFSYFVAFHCCVIARSLTRFLSPCIVGYNHWLWRNKKPQAADVSGYEQ